MAAPGIRTELTTWSEPTSDFTLAATDDTSLGEQCFCAGPPLCGQQACVFGEAARKQLNEQRVPLKKSRPVNIKLSKTA